METGLLALMESKVKRHGIWWDISELGSNSEKARVGVQRSIYIPETMNLTPKMKQTNKKQIMYVSG